MVLEQTRQVFLGTLGSQLLVEVRDDSPSPRASYLEANAD